MRKTREILRLSYECGLPHRQIARSCGISHVTVSKYLRCAEASGVGWPLPEGVSDEELQDLLFSSSPPEPKRALPEMSWIHEQLKVKGMTLIVLWEQYRQEEEGGYGYTQFCQYYRRWRSRIAPVLRQTHKAGEKMFVDWAGSKMSIWDSQREEERQVSIFVAVLGASSYTFCKAYENEKVASWIEAHIEAFEYFEGVAEQTVPDNPKTAVIRTCRYDPDLNPSYGDMAAHYGTAIVPARPGKPRDKAKAETAVGHVDRRILAGLRGRRFFGLGELNKAIGERLEELNQRGFQKMEGSRVDLYNRLEKPALRPLRSDRYELYEWKRAIVNIDYHVQADNHSYSVPYSLVGQEVEVRLRTRTVEVFARNKRVGLHARSSERGGFSTEPSHRPKSHQKHLACTPSSLLAWAQTVGEHCHQVVEFILNDKPHPEQGFRACKGIKSLGRRYKKERLEAACARAVARDVCTLRSIRSILEKKLDQQPLPNICAKRPAVEHSNMRGADYYSYCHEDEDLVLHY